MLAFLPEERPPGSYGGRPAHRAAVDAGQRPAVALVTPGRAGVLAVRPGPGLDGGVRRPARWRVGGALLRPPAARRAAARAALRAGHHDAGDPVARLLVTDYLDQHTVPHRTDLIRVISGDALPS